MVAGLDGSSLITVMVAAFAPKLRGSKRMGTGRKPPGAMVMGKDNTSATTNSGELEAMAATVRVHFPLLVRISGSSTKLPTQHFPKLPVLAMSKFSFGAGAKPDTKTVAGPVGSLLKIVIVPACPPKVRGSKRMTTSIESP